MPHLAADGPTPLLSPFLLPLVDRLNHSSEPAARSTRLAANAVVLVAGEDVKGSYVMLAQREISAGEEVLHSYGAQGSAGNA